MFGQHSWRSKEKCHLPEMVQAGREDFLDAVKKCKAAGLTPIIVGGADGCGAA
jgi:hypothetical protein